MGKRNLITGVVIGAIAGGVVSLISKDTQQYVNGKISLAKDQMGYMLNNPTQSIQKFQTNLIETAENAARSLDGTLNAVDQIESSINDIRKEDQKKLN